MIATILHSSRSFNAVDYNERKVAKGTAELLEIKNFDFLQTMGMLSPTDLKRYLIDYSSRNDRITNTQFHVAISCKGQEYTKEQLLEIAHKYLKEMGYANEGQPLLVYAHHDTNNNHIHIITSRVAPDGHKIDHNNERVRSMEVINRIMGVNRDQEAKTIIQNAFAYSFSSLGQFSAIIESSGYECYQEKEDLKLKKDGKVVESVPLKDIQIHFRQEDKKATEKRKKQLKAILAKYQLMAANKEELRALMKKKFGVDLIFVGSKDAPYGYHVVDHKEKAVYKGSSIMPIKTLLKFSNKNQNREELEAFINTQLQINPHITLLDLNKILRKKFALSIARNGQVERGIRKQHIYDISVNLLAQLKQNSKVSWVQSFHPQTETERAMLCRIFHLGNTDIAVEPMADNSSRQIETARHISEIIDYANPHNVFQRLRDGGYFIVRNEESFYVIDMRNAVVINLQNYGINTDKLQQTSQMLEQGQQHSYKSEKSQQGHHGSKLANVAKRILSSNGGGSINREWEVGSHDNWDDIDDERKLKR